jgi:hypothetical protein
LYTALLVIGPWLAALAYDLLLYAWRWAWHEMPVVGGRARGRPPPESSRAEPRLVSAAAAAAATAGGVVQLPAVGVVPLPVVGVVPLPVAGVASSPSGGEGAGEAAKRRRPRDELRGEGD